MINERNISQKAIGVPVLVKTFPVGNANVYPFEEVVVRPLNFIGFINYVRNYPSNSDQYTSFLYTYNVAAQYVDNLDELYLPDIYYAFYLFWGISINDNLSFNVSYTCDACGHKNNASVSMVDVSFRYYESPMFEISLGGKTYQCKFPTGKKIREHIPKLIASGKSKKMDFDIALLILSFIDFERRAFEIEQMVLNATHDDIVSLLSVLSDYILPPAKDANLVCEKCGHVNSVNYYGRVANDFFRIFMENRRFVAD